MSTLANLDQIGMFWQSTIGILCLIIFAVVSLINVYSPYCKDTLIDRVLYVATAFASIMGLVQIYSYGYPVNLTASLGVIFALRQVNNTAKRVIRLHWPNFSRRFHF